MPLTVIVTRDALPRVRGFLASCALELAPGVYTAPGMTRGVRERVWSVLSDWYASEPRGQVVMTWADDGAPGGQSFGFLGEPPKDLRLLDEMVLVRRPL